MVQLPFNAEIVYGSSVRICFYAFFERAACRKAWEMTKLNSSGFSITATFADELVLRITYGHNRHCRPFPN